MKTATDTLLAPAALPHNWVIAIAHDAAITRNLKSGIWPGTDSRPEYYHGTCTRRGCTLPQLKDSGLCRHCLSSDEAAYEEMVTA